MKRVIKSTLAILCSGSLCLSQAAPAAAEDTRSLGGLLNSALEYLSETEDGSDSDGDSLSAGEILDNTLEYFSETEAGGDSGSDEDSPSAGEILDSALEYILETEDETTTAEDLLNSALEWAFESEEGSLFVNGVLDETLKWLFETETDTKESSGVRDACQYLREQMEQGCTDISTHISGCEEWTDDELLTRLHDTIGTKATSYNYWFERNNDKTADFYVTPDYSDSVRMLWAYESGNTSGLSSEEQSCLNRAIEIVNEIKSENSSLYEQEIAIHDYICSHVTYYNPEDTNSDEFRRIITTCSALMDGYGNCQAYSGSFYLLGSIAGIEVRTMDGWYADPVTGAHMWNYVIDGDERRIVDVTFDDTDYESPWDHVYTYFNIGTDLTPENTHEWYDTTLGNEEISSTTDQSQTYYNGTDGAYFSSAYDAMCYCLDQRLNGADSAHCEIAGLYSDSDLQNAMSQAMNDYGYSSAASWQYLGTQNAGNTYLVSGWTS